MSQMPALARSDAAAIPASGRSNRRPSAPARSANRSHLRVVTAAPRPARRMPFIVLCSTVLAAGLLAVLFLNMALARGSYALHDLQRQSTILSEQQEALGEQLAAVSAPGILAQRATELGLVPGSSPAFLRLPDGQVLGVPQAAASAPADDAATPGAAAATQRAATPGAGDAAQPAGTTASRSANASESAKATARAATGPRSAPTQSAAR